jgi:hypothetical protein
VWSTTVTVNVFWIAALPCASVALQVTVVVVIPNVDPEAGEHDAAIAPSTASLALTGPKLTAAPPGPVASTPPMFEGGVMTGAVVSVIVTLKEPELELPCASVAVHVTVVLPKPNVEPEAGEQFGVTVPSTLSVALGLGENVTAAPLADVACALMFPGTVSEGATLSTTLTVNCACVVLLPSLALHVTVVSPTGKRSPLLWLQRA